ncbi:hypothetical protein HDU96_005735 [Phlyctochytrium bullatum]|nr:hypothetical protein HDU96_005735 [Phlyctochytrium bullatum]
MASDFKVTGTKFYEALVAGAVAGTAVDTVFFPLDTIKTRLQAKEGFVAAGGFKGLFRGLSSAVLGSAPGAATFFVTYEVCKTNLQGLVSADNMPFVHMFSASAGEVAACIVRVPTEVVKQRMQTGQFKQFSVAVSSIVRQDGIAGLYRGYVMTIFREFPLYEYLKVNVSTCESSSYQKLWRETYKEEAKPLATAVFGSIAGGVAAAVTTPLDVVKTRLMLSRKGGKEGYGGIFSTFSRIVKEEVWAPHSGDIFTSVSGDQTFKVWDLRIPKSSNTVRAHNNEILALDWNKYDPNLIATGSVDTTIKVWDLRFTQREAILLRGHEYAVRRLKFSPHSGCVIASTSYDMTMRIFDTSRPPNENMVHVHDTHTEFVLGVDLNMFIEGRVATCAWDEHVHVMDIPVLASGR